MTADAEPPAADAEPPGSEPQGAGSSALGASPAGPAGSSPALGRAQRLAVWGGVAVGVLLFTGLNLAFAEFSAAGVGLGLNTSSHQVTDPEGAVSGQLARIPELRRRARALRASGHSVALWVGASQLHAINDAEPGDSLAVAHANSASLARGGELRYLQVSAPNANLRELLEVYRDFRAAPASLPDRLILALTYDDLGEPGVRAEFTEVDAQLAVERRAGGGGGDHGDGAGGEGGPPPVGDSTPSRNRDEAAAPVARSATEGTPQEALEDALVGGLERVWPGYAQRGNTRSRLIVAWKEPLTGVLYRLRGRPGASPSPEVAAWNLEALDALFALTREDGVQLMLYKPPHRPGEQPFYHPRADYDAFFAQLEARCAEAGVPYLDLEPLVPAELWGLTNNYLPDVFHFQGPGHALLGEAIDRWVAEVAR